MTNRSGGIAALVSGVSLAVVLFVTIVGYATPAFVHYQTKVTEHELVVGRVVGFGAAIIFARDRLTGDEVVRYQAWAPPFIQDEFVTVEYKSSCQCIDSVNRWKGRYSFFATRQEDGSYSVSAGEAFKRSQRLSADALNIEYEKSLLEWGRKNAAPYL